MATTNIIQREKDRSQVKLYSYTTNQIIMGLTYDGHYLWGVGGATLVQFDLSGNVGISKELTGLSATIIDVAFNGENFGALFDKDPTFFSMGLVGREGSLLTPKNAIWGAGVSPNGIAFDGKHYWVVDSASPSILYQIDFLPSASIVKQFTLDASYSGLEFDGEFLITKNRTGFTVSLVYFDRSGNKVKTTSGEILLINQRPGIATDGNFIYTINSS
jgi:hypothetical protein